MSQVDEIKERVDIADIVSRYVQLKKSGSNHFGLCPFHSEKTPSFSVNSDLGLFKCFGCGESGDVITFVQKVEGWDFKEALEFLGKEVGIEVKFTPKDDKAERARERLFKLNLQSQNYFKHLLLKHKLGEEARAYLKKRKLTKESVETFGLGFAQGPDISYDLLTKSLLKKGWKTSELIAGGISVERKGKVIDKFRNRLMFSIYDQKGKLVGFSGRALKKSDYIPKYINTPETEVFHKSEVLYGLFQARKEIRDKNLAILVEGQTDVISSFQVGVKNIVAPLGTSLTEAHLKQLKKYTENIAICFDQDLAGEKALKRAIIMAKSIGFDVFAVPFEKYNDVDELIRSEPVLWQNISQKPIKVIDYLLKRLQKRIDINTVEGKVELIAELAPFLNAFQSQVKKDHYINEISRIVSIEKEIIIKELHSLMQQTGFKAKEDLKAKINSESTQNRELYFISLVIKHPQLIKKIKEDLNPEVFNNSVYRDLLSAVLLSETTEEYKKVIESLPEKVKKEIADQALQDFSDESLEEVEKSAKTVLRLLAERRTKRNLESVEKLMLKEKDKVKKKKLLKKYKELLAKLSEIKK